MADRLGMAGRNASLGPGIRGMAFSMACQDVVRPGADAPAIFEIRYDRNLQKRISRAPGAA